MSDTARVCVRSPGVANANSAVEVSGQGMSAWRWLLYATLARLQASEQAYFRLPEAKTLVHDGRDAAHK